jgi:acyl-CoA synthetase (AMP-forming)/AMP-acid ligase II
MFGPTPSSSPTSRARRMPSQPAALHPIASWPSSPAQPAGDPLHDLGRRGRRRGVCDQPDAPAETDRGPNAVRPGRGPRHAGPGFEQGMVRFCRRAAVASRPQDDRVRRHGRLPRRQKRQASSASVEAAAVGSRVKAVNLRQAMREQPSRPSARPRDTRRAHIFYVCTGGTTGAPKIAVRTHRSEVFDAWAVTQVMATDEAPRTILCGLPLFHVNGQLCILKTLSA